MNTWYPASDPYWEAERPEDQEDQDLCQRTGHGPDPTCPCEACQREDGGR